MPLLPELHDNPRAERAAAVTAVSALVFLTLVLQLALDIDGVLDTDTINFGLAAFRFDITDHQPHPPGYPGYVLFLKVIHLLFPNLGPIDVAKWGSRLCGMATVCAAYWVGTRSLSDEAAPGRGRPLLCAVVAAFHPVIWYYGADGQSHAAEALLTLLLFGASVAVKARSDLRSRLLLVIAFGLAGSVRPTIPLLSSPLLVWVFWRRPVRDWVIAMGTGVAATASWYVPLIVASGGWELYTRAQRALVFDLFLKNYSLFATEEPRLALFNATVAVQYAALSLLPLLAWGGRRPPWQRAFAAVIVTNVVFYAVVYIAEAGYLSGVAALACLVPATFQCPLRLHTRLRLAAAIVMGLVFTTLGPGDMPILGTPFRAWIPTIQHTVDVETVEHFYRDRVCRAARGEPALVITDNPNTTHTHL
ncbi:MAG: DUF2723 domain-containing protein, partial [Deltaproteobacteria bacterium]